MEGPQELRPEKPFTGSNLKTPYFLETYEREEKPGNYFRSALPNCASTVLLETPQPKFSSLVGPAQRN